MIQLLKQNHVKTMKKWQRINKKSWEKEQERRYLEDQVVYKKELRGSLRIHLRHRINCCRDLMRKWNSLMKLWKIVYGWVYYQGLVRYRQDMLDSHWCTCIFHCTCFLLLSGIFWDIMISWFWLLENKCLLLLLVL